MNNKDTDKNDKNNSNVEDDIKDNTQNKDITKQQIIPQQDIELIKNALEFYDKNKDKYSEKFKKVKYIHNEMSDTDTTQTVKYFYDESFNLLFKSRCEYIGIFDEKYGMWSWAWSIGFFKKNETNIKNQRQELKELKL